MKIFRYLQMQYAIVGISSSSQLDQELPFSIRVLIGFIIFGWNIVCLFLYIFYVANGFMEYMLCICVTSGTLIIFVCFAAIVYRKDTLFEVIDNMEELIDTRQKYRKSKAFFFKSSQQIERLSEIIFTAVMKIALQFYMLPTSIGSFIVYFVTDSGGDAFQLPIPTWFPFDINNPMGYLIAVTLEYITFGYEYFIIACTLGLGIAGFWMIISATKEIQRILQKISDKSKAKQNQANELKILFSEYIDAHAAIKQVESNFSDTLQPIIVSLFLWSLLAISGAMFIIQVELLDHGNVMPVLLLIFNGVVAFGTVFIACELGQRLSDAFDEIDYNREQFDWYLFPIEIKRMLTMIIVNAQEPVSLECFGSIICTRETLKNVIHCAFSYFMVLRQLNG